MAIVFEAYSQIRGKLDRIQKESLAATPGIICVAASKAQTSLAIIEAIKAGITHFGENKVQETSEKWSEIKKTYPHIILQHIGTLQTNKVKEAVSLYDEIASLDRAALAEALTKEMQKQQKQLPCLIQVNTGEEDQKSGVLPKDAPDFIRYCRDELKLPIAGLMCVPPVDDYPAPHFALIAKLAKEHQLKRLSMGMSHDYEIAARMGATEVRIGTALFGARS